MDWRTDWWMWASCPVQEDETILRRGDESLNRKGGNENRKK